VGGVLGEGGWVVGSMGWQLNKRASRDCDLYNDRRLGVQPRTDVELSPPAIGNWNMGIGYWE